MSISLRIRSFSSADTMKLGKRLGNLLYRPEIILLTGNLGTGKTIFVKGIARGLDITDNVNSPSYTLIKEYEGRLPLYHMDLYRLDDEKDLYNIGFEEYLNDDGIVVIEWPELAREFLPSHCIAIDIKIGKDNNREILIKAREEIKKGLLPYVNHRN